MACYSISVALFSSSPISSSTKKRGSPVACARAKWGNYEEDPFMQEAVRAASLRFLETLNPEPLFSDPYAECFLPPLADKSMEHNPSYYCLATKYFDDKLICTMKQVDELRQVVLLTDGMDTRPYRLNWPRSTIMFDISPGRIFKIASQRLEGIGAKLPRTCMLLHVPLESYGIVEVLRQKGFSGNRPSIWVLQGLPTITLQGVKEIFSVVSSLAMQGSLFIGELPLWIAETEFGTKSNQEKWMDKLFMCNGFRVDVISYEEIARNVHRKLPLGDFRNVLFVSRQLRLSDDQADSWRREFQRVEGEGDEEGFEDL